MFATIKGGTVGRRVGQGILTLVLTVSLAVAPASATSTCTAESDVHEVQADNGTLVNITIHNTGSTPIVWLDFTVPNDSYTFAGNSINSPWSTADHAGGTTATGGSIAAGDSGTYNLAVSAGHDASASANWQVLTDDDASGATPSTCAGELGLETTALPPPPPPECEAPFQYGVYPDCKTGGGVSHRDAELFGYGVAAFVAYLIIHQFRWRGTD